MPCIEEIIEAVGKSNIISKLHLSKGYYQMKVQERDRENSEFVCYIGKFEFTHILFEVCNALAVFRPSWMRSWKK